MVYQITEIIAISNNQYFESKHVKDFLTEEYTVSSSCRPRYCMNLQRTKNCQNSRVFACNLFQSERLDLGARM